MSAFEVLLLKLTYVNIIYNNNRLIRREKTSPRDSGMVK